MSNDGNLHQLLYTSVADHVLSADELADLLVDARIKNDALGVTGFLLFKSGAFIQLLEGDRRCLLELFDTIKEDTRHKNVECLHFDAASHRVCPNWAMKIQNLDFGEPDSLTGIEEVISKLHEEFTEENESPAAQLIRFFDRAG